MSMHVKARRLVSRGAVLALLALGFFAFTPSALPHTLAQTAPTPVPASRLRLPITIVNFDFPLLSTVEGAGMVAPGGLVKVDGSNFGDSAGSLCMRWSQVVVNNDFTKNSQDCLSITDWQPTRIIAEVPSGIIGVPDQTAHLVVTRGDGLQSNQLDIKFVATRTVITATNDPGLGNPLIIDCSTAASNSNYCNATNAGHQNGLCCSAADELGSVGQDTYHVHLSHGWTVQSVSFSVTDGDATLIAQPSAGASIGHASVNWSAGGFRGSANYLIFIQVVGPLGVPLD